MTRLYANENVPLPVVQQLRERGHDVLTSVEAGRANQRIPDREVLDYASSLERAVLTHNWRDFKKLHVSVPDHGGIVGFPPDADSISLASRIHSALAIHNSTRGKCLRITKDGVRLVARDRI